ncbi:hypothetical protein A2335_00185 [Candidatus Peregrinibacteria bacterium RIFOXYB2_FULL_32_7]|nr:MAG: hypothetical protein A2335_00185 [Candidatus Peregrinibacteria bacterium RIFOXYB2_FULL_32_7]
MTDLMEAVETVEGVEIDAEGAETSSGRSFNEVTGYLRKRILALMGDPTISDSECHYVSAVEASRLDVFRQDNTALTAILPAEDRASCEGVINRLKKAFSVEKEKTSEYLIKIVIVLMVAKNQDPKLYLTTSGLSTILNLSSDVRMPVVTAYLKNQRLKRILRTFGLEIVVDKRYVNHQQFCFYAINKTEDVNPFEASSQEKFLDPGDMEERPQDLGVGDLVDATHLECEKQPLSLSDIEARLQGFQYTDRYTFNVAGLRAGYLADATKGLELEVITDSEIYQQRGEEFGLKPNDGYVLVRRKNIKSGINGYAPIIKVKKSDLRPVSFDDYLNNLISKTYGIEFNFQQAFRFTINLLNNRINHSVKFLKLFSSVVRKVRLASLTDYQGKFDAGNIHIGDPKILVTLEYNVGRLGIVKRLIDVCDLNFEERELSSFLTAEAFCRGEGIAIPLDQLGEIQSRFAQV